MRRIDAIAAMAMTAGMILMPVKLQAHRQWMLPSSTVLSGSDVWVTVDAAVSNELFYFDHVPMRTGGLIVTGPDGSRLQPENLSTGKYRSTFDVHLTQSGTYKIATVNNSVFASWEENGSAKNWRGSADAFTKEVPQDAKGLQVSRMNSRVEVFVTSGKPTQTALKPTGVGLELVPETHPNDLVAGERATFQLLLDSKPAANLEVTMIPGGIRYRDQLHEAKATTDAEGKFTFTPKDPGMYWLNATTGGGRSGGPRPPGAAARSLPARQEGAPPQTFRMPAGNRAMYSATLEVLP